MPSTKQPAKKRPATGESFGRKAKTAKPNAPPSALWENTVLIASNHPELNQLLGAIKVEGLHLHVSQRPQDILAVPCCLMFVDAIRLDRKLLAGLSQLALAEETPSWKIIVVGQMPNIPEELARHIEPAPYVWSRKVLVTRINATMASARGEQKRQAQFHDRVYRIVSLHNHIKEGRAVELDKLLGTYGISERTIRRDLKVLRDLFPHLPIMYNRKFKE